MLIFAFSLLARAAKKKKALRDLELDRADIIQYKKTFDEYKILKDICEREFDDAIGCSRKQGPLPNLNSLSPAEQKHHREIAATSIRATNILNRHIGLWSFSLYGIQARQEKNLGACRRHGVETGILEQIEALRKEAIRLDETLLHDELWSCRARNKTTGDYLLTGVYKRVTAQQAEAMFEEALGNLFQALKEEVARARSTRPDVV